MNFTVFAPLGAAGLIVGRTEAVLAFGVGFVVGTLLVTPDLDLRFNDAARRWGPLRFVWTPYHLLSRHRGVSHTYVLGPVTRAVYLLLWVLPALVVSGLVRPGEVGGAPWSVIPPGMGEVLTRAFAGYLMAQWLHLMADGIWPFMPARASRRRA